MFIIRARAYASCLSQAINESVTQSSWKFFIDRVKRISAASEALCNSLLVKNKFRVHVEQPRANLRLSEMLLGKFRVAATEARSFMRAYL